MSTIISGSLAYDYIMDFPDSFKNHILPDQIHILNVCFVVNKLQKNIGGCATNIAYTMNLLGEKPHVIGPVGNDGAEILSFFEKNNIDTSNIPMQKNVLSSMAQITSDKDGNQIIAYYNGAGDHATEVHVDDVKEDTSFAIVAPTKKEAMLQHAKECYNKKIPFCFDPSHQLGAFTPQELMATIGLADIYIANDYELKLTEEKTGWDKEELLNHVDILITTLGEKGSVVATKENVFTIPPCKVLSIEDPTGAGDAYRGGFFAAYAQKHDLETCAKVASVAAAYAIEHYGTINHHYTLETFKKRYEENYNQSINLAL
ncbi:carbohydrate kinase family protein [Patescibacteria group bacterium]|nr:carbohydrate kinase family protein [Patescibacteria group bacterium]MBU1721336.1 carbohydrate kinase family protein [Patescibacteria group bacterium]MBU1901621.1 carbohydrate kinase family protein [Patescibacteria group bacterium]